MLGEMRLRSRQSSRIQVHETGDSDALFLLLRRVLRKGRQIRPATRNATNVRMYSRYSKTYRRGEPSYLVMPGATGEQWQENTPGCSDITHKNQRRCLRPKFGDELVRSRSLRQMPAGPRDHRVACEGSREEPFHSFLAAGCGEVHVTQHSVILSGAVVALA